MQSPINTLMVVGLLVLPVFSGCANKENTQLYASAPSGQRVVRVSFRGERIFFRIRINQNPVERLRVSEFTNVMTHLQLAYGDIVVWEDKRDDKGRELTHPDDISKWWFRHLEEVRASFYSISSDNVTDFFATPIYHWLAPAEKPRPLSDATFFVDGLNLGRGSNGFRVMIEAIESKKEGWLYIVAPRIKNEGQASPWIAENQLTSWADEARMQKRFEKILFGQYGGLLDFARLMDK